MLFVKGNTAIANVNPIRYRSYYYDRETALYYLNSRYYDPETGRFINADEPEFILDKNIQNNIFIYCENNPILYSDNTGNARSRLVAVGIQFEISLGIFTGGVEIILVNENQSFQFYVFVYGGFSMEKDFWNDVAKVLKTASKGIKKVKKLFSFSWSICLMAIFSTKAFNPKTYKGPFKGFSVTIPIIFTRVSVKTFCSWSSDYVVGGLGFCKRSMKKQFGYSHVNYIDVTDGVKSIINSVARSCHQGIQSQAKKIKP